MKTVNRMVKLNVLILTNDDSKDTYMFFFNSLFTNMKIGSDVLASKMEEHCASLNRKGLITNRAIISDNLDVKYTIFY